MDKLGTRCEIWWLFTLAYWT